MVANYGTGLTLTIALALTCRRIWGSWFGLIARARRAQSASPGFGVRYLLLIFVCADPVMAVSVEFS
jgi:hypothetical protein